MFLKALLKILEKLRTKVIRTSAGRPDHLAADRGRDRVAKITYPFNTMTKSYMFGGQLEKCFMCVSAAHGIFCAFPPQAQCTHFTHLVVQQGVIPTRSSATVPLHKPLPIFHTPFGPF